MSSDYYRVARSRSQSACYTDYQAFDRWQQETGDLYDGRSHSLSELNQSDRQNQQHGGSDTIEWLCDNVYSNNNNTYDQQHMQHLFHQQQLQQPQYFQQYQGQQWSQQQLRLKQQHDQQQLILQQKRYGQQQQQQHGPQQQQQHAQQPQRQDIRNSGDREWLCNDEYVNNVQQQHQQQYRQPLHHLKQHSCPEQQPDMNQRQLLQWQQQQQDFIMYDEDMDQDRRRTWPRDSRSRSLDDVTAYHRGGNAGMMSEDWDGHHSYYMDACRDSPESPTNSLFLTNGDTSDDSYNRRGTVRNDSNSFGNTASQNSGTNPAPFMSFSGKERGLSDAKRNVSSNVERFYALPRIRSAVSSRPSRFGACMFTVTGVEKCSSDNEGNDGSQTIDTTDRVRYERHSFHARPKPIYAYPEVPVALESYSKRHRYVRERIVPNEAPDIPSRPEILRYPTYSKNTRPQHDIVLNTELNPEITTIRQMKKIPQHKNERVLETTYGGEQQQQQQRLSNPLIGQTELRQKPQPLPRQQNSQTQHVELEHGRHFSVNASPRYQVSNVELTKDRRLNTTLNRPKPVDTRNVVYPSHQAETFTEYIPISSGSKGFMN